MDPFLIVLLVAVFVGGLLVGVGWSVCDEDEEWDDEATFTTSYPEGPMTVNGTIDPERAPGRAPFQPMPRDFGEIPKHLGGRPEDR